jgi:predicted O-methyltransferase YrrM
MMSYPFGKPPAALAAISRETERLGFTMASAPATGALLRTLAAGRTGGRLLELGTGTGLATAWLLDGMDAAAGLTSIDVDTIPSAVAGRFLGDDPRLTLVVADAGAWLRTAAEGPYDLIFADAIPGKFEAFDAAWRLLAVGGFYVVDDMLPEPGWPAGHADKVAALLDDLEARTNGRLVRLDWSTGLVIAARTR